MRDSPNLRGRAARIIGSSWTLGILVAIGSWNITLLPPAGGLDPSWQAALYMAARRGMHFGSQIVFTYGPLGFMRIPGLWYQGLGIVSFVYWGGLYVLLCVSLVWVVRRPLGAVAAFVLTLLTLAAAPSVETPIALAALWCLAMLAPEPPAFGWPLVVFGGAVLGAVETLALPRSGLVILAMCAVTILTHPRRWRQLAMFAGCAALTLVVAWFASGQSLGNIPEFLRNTEQVVAGYSEAMGTTSGSALYVPGAILVGIVLVAGAALAAAPGPRRVAAAVVIAAASFVLYKEAIVRQDTGHAQILFATAAPIALALAVSARRWLALIAAGGALVLAIATPRAAFEPLSLNPITHARRVGDQVQKLASPARTQFLAAVALALQYRLDPPTLQLLRGHTVDIDPWEASLAWTYRLDWEPLPVIQDYNAYTATLDRADAHLLASAAGPERILRENTTLVDPAAPNGTIDGRLAAWDPPAKTIAMLCHYAPLRTTARWQVLGRTANRCGVPRLIGTLHARNGQTVRLPDAGAGAVLEARLLGVGVSGFERLRTFLYRARFRYLTVNGRSTYRLVPGTAGDGLVTDADPKVDFPAPFAVSPGARTIAVSGAPGTVTVELYRIPVARR